MKFGTFCWNEEVEVILEFPKQPDKESERKFVERLKELYLRRLDAEAVQMGEGAASFFDLAEGEGEG